MTTDIRTSTLLDLRDVFGIARRPIVYELLHYPRAGVGPEQYESTMHALHAAIASHSADLTRIARGRTGADPSAIGAIGATWARLIRLEPFPANESPDAARALAVHLDRGRAYLGGLGLPADRAAAVYESVFAVDGAAQLEVLEHIVRDRIGVYGGAHGRHVVEQAAFLVTVRNLVGGDGASPGASGRAAILYTTRRSGTPESFRAEFAEALASIGADRVPSLSLWERKLGLGPGLDFTLRLSGFADDDALAACIAALTGPSASEGVRAAVDGGALVTGRVLTG